MIRGYKSLQRYCHSHEWAAVLSAILLLFLLTSSIFLALDYQGAIWQWLSDSLLVHGLMLITTMLIAGLLSLSLLCLSFCPKSQEELAEMASYRHRPMLSESLEMVRNLGGNPKRRHRKVRNASA